MSKNELLPLIVPDDEYYEEEQQTSYLSHAQIGYLILISVWVLFLVSINSFFEIWRFVVSPLGKYPETNGLHEQLVNFFLAVDYYVMSMWCLYVVLWWWALLSWIGLKLFRQSKGLQT